MGMSLRGRKKDGQVERQTNRDRQTDRKRDKQADRDKNTENPQQNVSSSCREDLMSMLCLLQTVSRCTT